MDPLALKFSGVFRYTSRGCPWEYRLPEATARPQPRPFSYKKAVCECLLSLVTQTSLLAAFSDTLFIRRCDWCGQYHLGITSTSIWILNLVSVVREDPCDGLDRGVLSTFQCLGSLSCPALALIQLVYDDSRCVTLIFVLHSHAAVHLLYAGPHSFHRSCDSFGKRVFK